MGALAACSTPYQQMGVLGGVNAVRITQDTAQITARGNAYTDPDVIQRYALRRAAEETINDGYDLFRIGGDTDRSLNGSQSFGFATGNRRSVFGSAFSMPVIKPGETLMIKMYKGPRPDPMPDGLFDAHEVLRFAEAAAASKDHKDCATVDDKVQCK
ncbi:MAG: CC0125/CC1285 family lipoprotein [Caulobacteraceae bacterium]